jgi:DNA-binding transcriptional ArsR family regulator
VQDITEEPLDAHHADALRRFKARVFQVLAHPTRIHIVECLAESEQPVGVLLDQVKVEPANLSQHLAVLRAEQLVLTRKEGNQVFYRLRDPMLAEVLASMRRYFIGHLQESLVMLKILEAG